MNLGELKERAFNLPCSLDKKRLVFADGSPVSAITVQADFIEISGEHRQASIAKAVTQLQIALENSSIAYPRVVKALAMLREVEEILIA